MIRLNCRADTIIMLYLPFPQTECSTSCVTRDTGRAHGNSCHMIFPLSQNMIKINRATVHMPMIATLVIIL